MTEQVVHSCDHHDTWDAELEPTGDACEQPAEFMITWTDTEQFSFACAEHATDIDPRAAAHAVSRLDDE